MKMIHPKLNKKWKVILLIYVSLKALICSDCNFDVDICNWSNDDHSDFNWTRQNGKTPSEYTGPDGDHTTGDGQYIFIESSSPRTPGEKARLISPMQASGHACLVFWYSLYGQGIGSLNIYMKTATPKDILIFSRNNSFDNNIWIKAVVTLMSPDDYQIVIEGIVGSAKGDIAIDDIILKNGTCSAGCNFGDGLCNWKQDQNDSFDWTRWSDETPTKYTGPLSDHELGNMSDSYYMYIETSHPRVDGEAARLISPVQVNGQYCLTFWYSMFGQHVNKLSVYVKTEPCLETLIFSRENGTDDMNWIKAELSFTSVYEFEIIIEGVCGNGIEGDIAVDDITLKDDKCDAETESAVQILASCQQIYETSTKSSSFITDVETTSMTKSATSILTAPVLTTTTMFVTKIPSTMKQDNNITSSISLTSITFKTGSSTSVQTTKNEIITTSAKYPNTSQKSISTSGHTTSSLSKITVTTPALNTSSSKITNAFKTISTGGTKIPSTMKQDNKITSSISLTSITFETRSSTSVQTTKNERITTSAKYSNTSQKSISTSGNTTRSVSKITVTTPALNTSSSKTTNAFKTISTGGTKTTKIAGTASSSKTTSATTTTDLISRTLKINSTATITTEEDFSTGNFSKTKTTTNILNTMEMGDLTSTTKSTITTTMKFITESRTVQQQSENPRETVTYSTNITHNLTTNSAMTTQGADIEMYYLIIPIFVVLVIVVSVSFAIWRRKKKNKLVFNERKFANCYKDNRGLPATDENTCDRNSDDTNAPSEHRLSYRNDYMEVFLQNAPYLDATDGNCNSYSQNQYVTNDNKHIYNHLKTQKGCFIDNTYSHTSDLHTLKANDSPDQLDQALWEIDKTSKDEGSSAIQLDHDCDVTYSRLQPSDLNNFADTVSVAENGFDIENTYNTLCAGGPSKRDRTTDDYSHINLATSSGLFKESSTYTYARVNKQIPGKSDKIADCVDLSDRYITSECDISLHLFELDDANDDIDNHDYYILEKI